MEFSGSAAVFSENYKFTDELGKFASEEMKEEIPKINFLKQKQAAAKTSVADFLKKKKAKELFESSEEVPEDALKAGNTGLVKAFVTLINPFTYIKKWFALLLAALIPYVVSFMLASASMVVVVMIIFSILVPISKVSQGLNSFLSFVSGGGGYVNTAFTNEELEEILAASEAEGGNQDVVRFVLSKVGYAYSQDERASGDAFDCSSLAYYAWKDAGKDISFGGGYPPTAAEEARQLEKHRKDLDEFDPIPGDLIFYGGKINGRYMGIYHVAIYVGNGMVVEALNESSGVVYRDLRTSNACMICRP